MSDHTLKAATPLINVDRAWHVAPKQPGLKSGQLCCLGCSSTDGLLMLMIHDSQPAKETDRRSEGKLPQNLVNRIIGQWRRRLGCVVQQQSGHIKHLM